MHELSVAQNVVEIIKGQVPENELRNVVFVRLRVGALAGIVCESLEFCYGVITDKTPLQHSKLKIDYVPTKIHCRTCSTTSPTEPNFLVCPVCSGREVELESGMELQVVELELTDQPLEVV